GKRLTGAYTRERVCPPPIDSEGGGGHNDRAHALRRTSRPAGDPWLGARETRVGGGRGGWPPCAAHRRARVGEDDAGPRTARSATATVRDRGGRRHRATGDGGAAAGGRRSLRAAALRG